MARRNSDDTTPDPSAPSIVAEGDDAEDPRTFEPEGAQAVREGELSAAQLPEGHGNVDPANPDAQYPPGVVQNTAQSSPEQRAGVDAADFVPERRTSTGLTNTAATPDFGTNSEE